MSRGKQTRAQAREVGLRETLDPETLDWYRLTPAQRWVESEKLWATYLALGGSLAPEPDFAKSIFYDAETPCLRPVDGRAGLRAVRGAEFSPTSISPSILDTRNSIASEEPWPSWRRSRCMFRLWARRYSMRGHACHFRSARPVEPDLRIDVMSVMRGCDAFACCGHGDDG